MSDKVELRSKRIAELLGMSHGAAAQRLRKLILFRQLKKYNDNICVRCNKTIEMVDELSIEHIEPWENRSAELFWDLDNVAFSHIICNVQHTYSNAGGLARRTSFSDGKSWCRTCKEHKLISEFSSRSSRWNGLRHDCKKCEKNYKDRIRGKVLEDGEHGAQPVSNTGPTLAG